MCEICGQSPCDYRCPNAEETRRTVECDDCGKRIRFGYKLPVHGGWRMFCRDCAEEWFENCRCDADEYEG